MAKIAVVGAGIFGITSALKLSEQHQVDLYETNPDIMQAASGINQFRLHRGYHYPRSPQTILECKNSEPLFRNFYPEAVINTIDNYYCIAKVNSLTTGTRFLEVCRNNNLEYQIETPSLVNQDAIDICVKVNEDNIDPFVLHKICWDKLKLCKVNTLLNTQANNHILEKYNYVIDCTYANLNTLIDSFPDFQKEYQFELCEKIVISLPAEFNNKSVVVLDGPFMNFDPYGTSGKFLMGNVVHAILQTNIGLNPQIDDKFQPLLNKGIIKNPPITNFNKFIDSAKTFFPKISQAKHIGSMYTIRTVLPYKDQTDERPTFVDKVSDKIITVFSGKFSNCVSAAQEVVALIK